MPAISATQSVTEIRPSDYGTYLRLPADLVPRQRSLGNNLGDVAVDTIELPNCVGGGPSATFSLKSDDICRFHLLSGGAYLFTSAQPSSVFQTALGSETFAGTQSPIVGWTALSSTVGSFQASNGQGIGMSGNAIVNVATLDGTQNTSYVEVQADYQNGVTGVNGRIGVGALLSGISGYLLYVQGWAGGNPNSTMSFVKLAGSQLNLGVVSAAKGLSAGTMKLVASASVATVYLSAFYNGGLIGSYADAASPVLSGKAGIFHQTVAGGFTSSGDWLDNWQSLQVTSPPYNQPDIVLGVSADGWIQRGQTEAARWAQFYYQDLRLGVDSHVTLAGSVSAVVSAGTSAFLPTTTYGIVQTRVSSVATANLGAGHSTSNGLLVVISDTSALAWYVSGVRVSAAGAVF